MAWRPLCPWPGPGAAASLAPQGKALERGDLGGQRVLAPSNPGLQVPLTGPSWATSSRPEARAASEGEGGRESGCSGQWGSVLGPRDGEEGESGWDSTCKALSLSWSLYGGGSEKTQETLLDVGPTIRGVRLAPWAADFSSIDRGAGREHGPSMKVSAPKAKVASAPPQEWPSGDQPGAPRAGALSGILALSAWNLLPAPSSSRGS